MILARVLRRTGSPFKILLIVWWLTLVSRSRSLLKYPSGDVRRFDKPHHQTEFRSWSFRSAPDGRGAGGWAGGLMRPAPAVSGYESG